MGMEVDGRDECSIRAILRNVYQLGPPPSIIEDSTWLRDDRMVGVCKSDAIGMNSMMDDSVVQCSLSFHKNSGKAIRPSLFAILRRLDFRYRPLCQLSVPPTLLLRVILPALVLVGSPVFVVRNGTKRSLRKRRYTPNFPIHTAWSRGTKAIVGGLEL